MFRIFTFKFGDSINSSNIEKMNKVISSILDSRYINEFTENYVDDFLNTNDNEIEKVNEVDFIELNEYEDMYLLTIELKGINLRELSIRYEFGIIEINLKRAEIEKSNLGGLFGNKVVKKVYSKRFENIEEIDTDQILKNIDKGILSIRMQKKYAVESILDVDSYEDNVDN